MVNAFVTLCFLLVASGAATVIWVTIADNRVAILSALGLTGTLAQAYLAERRVSALSGHRAVVTVRASTATAARRAA